MVEKGLIDFIQAALSKNIPLEQIKRQLKQKGWSEELINEAINQLNKPKKSKKKLILIIGIIVLILLLSLWTYNIYRTASDKSEIVDNQTKSEIQKLFAAEGSIQQVDENSSSMNDPI